MSAVLRLAIGLCLLTPALAQAHRPSDAFLTLDLHQGQITGQWEIALRDLDVALGLDSDSDHQLTWGELRTARPRLEAEVLPTLALTADARPCALRISDLKVDDRVEGRFAWIALAGECDTAPDRVRLSYHFLFDIDPTHRLILVLSGQGRSQTAVLGPDEPERVFDLGTGSRWSAFRDYLVHGIWHIWMGYDHILFLLALLFPSVLRVADGAWSAEPRLAPVVKNVVAVVTAFTLAHSITLTLAALDFVRLPSAGVELVIALSVMLAALNNIVPVVERRRWALAFGFGLVHGFGFASVLSELGLPIDARVTTLVAFNLGVEAGQLVIVGVVLPLAFSIRNTTFYRRGVRVGGSAAVAVLAAVWLVERGAALIY